MMSSNGFVAMAERVFPDDVILKRIDSPTISNDGGSEPVVPPDSPISCVSSRLQEEYDELLKYAVVVPAFNPTVRPHLTTGPVLKSTGDQLPPITISAEPLVGTSTMQKTSSTTSKSTGSKVIHAAKPLGGGDRDDYFDKLSTVESDVGGISAHHWLDLDHPVQGDRPRHVTSKGHLAALEESSNATEVEPSDTYAYTVTVDQDVSHMEALMDDWTAELKRKVLAEFSQTKIRILENHRHQMMKQKDVYHGDMRKQVDETESIKELLHTYEQSIERKDQVIANLTASLQSHRNKMEIQKSFCEWKIKHNDVKREGFASNLAKRHYQQTLKRKIWDAWHSVIENRWRQRVEKACQAKAQEVCISLTNDYETKLASLNEALESAREEVLRLHRERNMYEETMKKAFMRGVCALNLEAMTMFHEGDRGSESKVRQNSDRTEQESDNLPVGSSATVPQEFVYSSEPMPGPPPPRVVTAAGASRSSTTIASQQLSASSKTDVGKSKVSQKVISTKVTARPSDSTRSASITNYGVAPPMTSVIVERHLQFNKETIGPAIASKYPRSTNTQQQPAVQRRLAGQGTAFPMPNTNIQTIKVVE